VVIGVPAGFLIDKIGIKYSLVIGSIFNTVGRIVFALSGTLWMQLLGLFVGTTVGAGLFISALHIGVKRYSGTKPSQTVAFHLLYWAMNIGAIGAMLGTDLALDSTFLWEGYQLLFVLGAVTSMATFVASVFFKEIEVKIEKFTFKQYLAVVREKPFWKLLGFNFCLIPVKAMFRYMDALLPIYLTRVYPGVSYGAVLAVNPICIILLTPIAGLLTKRLHFVYGLVALGSLISALSPLPAVSWHELSSIITFLVIFTFGEAIYSPKVGQFSLENSPKGKEGIYSGLIPIPYFAGNIVAGSFSGWLLDAYCPDNDSSSSTASGFDPVFAQECSKVWGWIIGTSLLSPIVLILLYRLLRFKQTEVSRYFELHTQDAANHE